MRARIDSPLSNAPLHPADYEVSGEIWVDGDKQASAIYKLETIHGITVLINAIKNGRRIAFDDAQLLTVWLRQQGLRIWYATRYMTIQDEVYEGKDWTVEGTKYSNFQAQRALHNAVLTTMSEKQDAVFNTLERVSEIWKLLVTIQRVAQTVHAAKEEHGESYFNDAIRVARYTVAVKCIDAAWVDMQAKRQELGHVAQALRIMAVPPFKVPVQLRYNNGGTRAAVFDLNEHEFFERRHDPNVQSVRIKAAQEGDEGVDMTLSEIFNPADMGNAGSGEVGPDEVDIVAINAATLGISGGNEGNED